LNEDLRSEEKRMDEERRGWMRREEDG